MRIALAAAFLLPLLPAQRPASPPPSRDPAQDAPASGRAIAPPPDVLLAARELATGRFRSFVYGPGLDEKAKIVDCTCFVWAVVERLAADCGVAATPELRRAVLIANIGKAEDLRALVDGDDARIRGIATALVDAGLGRRIAPEDARPGDFVQYWYRPRRGAKDWAGHASIVERIVDGKAVLLGSHRSTLRERADGDEAIAVERGGIGSGPTFDLRDASRKVYVVRWTRPARAKGEAKGEASGEAKGERGAKGERREPERGR